MRLKTVFFVVVLAVLAGSTVFSKTPRQKHREERHKGQDTLIVRPIHWKIGPSFTAGYLTGTWAEEFDKAAEKILYGIGIDLDYYPKSRYSLGASVGWVWKDIPIKNFSVVRGFTVAGTYTQYLGRLRRKNPYLRFLLGSTSVKMLEGEEGIQARDCNSHLTFSAGLGLLIYGGSNSTYRIELYFHHIEGDKNYAGAEFYGLRLGFGFPFFRKS